MTGPRHADRPEHTLHPDELEVAPGTERETLQGWIPSLATDEELREALEKAFDYRGDVSITRKDGATFEGYLFDRVSGKTLESCFVRLLPKDSESNASKSVMRKLPHWPFPGGIPPPARAGKPG